MVKQFWFAVQDEPKNGVMNCGSFSFLEAIDLLQKRVEEQPGSSPAICTIYADVGGVADIVDMDDVPRIKDVIRRVEDSTLFTEAEIFLSVMDDDDLSFHVRRKDCGPMGLYVYLERAGLLEEYLAIYSRMGDTVDLQAYLTEADGVLHVDHRSLRG